MGDVDAQEGQILMTSIPYEPGWKIQVDGKTVDSLVVNQKNADGTTTLSNAEGDTGEIIVLNALIGIKLPAGHHTVSMKYTPPGFNLGVVTLILGIAIIVLIYLKSDKKIIAQLAEQQKKLEEEQQKAQKKAKEKVNKLIKSKGAVANIDIEKMDNKDDNSENPENKNDSEK